MKKNKMMRIAAVLLVVTLLSTCAISGTFAKYVTRESVNDEARVAKWGVTVTTDSDLFSQTYATDDDTYAGEFSVVSSNDDQLVAPGTAGNGMSAVISGKPEVATRFAIKIMLNDIADVLLPFGTYTDYTNNFADGQFTLANPAAGTRFERFLKGYSPVKWDVTITRIKDDGTYGRSESLIDTAAQVLAAYPQFAQLAPLVEDGVSLTDAATIVEQISARDDLKTMMNNLVASQFAHTGASNVQVEAIKNADNEVLGFEISMDFDPNSNLNYEIAANWHWDFEQTNETYGQAYTDLFDAADTYIGNVAAEIVADPTCTTDIRFAFEASATQID